MANRHQLRRRLRRAISYSIVASLVFFGLLEVPVYLTTGRLLLVELYGAASVVMGMMIVVSFGIFRVRLRLRIISIFIIFTALTVFVFGHTGTGFLFSLPQATAYQLLSFILAVFGFISITLGSATAYLFEVYSRGPLWLRALFGTFTVVFLVFNFFLGKILFNSTIAFALAAVVIATPTIMQFLTHRQQMFLVQSVAVAFEFVLLGLLLTIIGGFVDLSSWQTYQIAIPSPTSGPFAAYTYNSVPLVGSMFNSAFVLGGLGFCWIMFELLLTLSRREPGRDQLPPLPGVYRAAQSIR